MTAFTRDPRTVAVFAGLALTGVAIGVAGAAMTGHGSDNSTLHPAVAVTTSTSPTTTPSTSPSASPSPTGPSPSPTTTKPVPPDYSAIPVDAAAHKDLDFGYLTAVHRNGDLMTIGFDRATFYTGAEAIKHNGGKPPPDDYLIENTNPALRTFQVMTKASLIGVFRLLQAPAPAGTPPIPATGITRTPLTPDQFTTNATAALANGQGVAVWLRHADDPLNGPVTAVAEQYLP